jgi:CspA family cold shock protein
VQVQDKELLESNGWVVECDYPFEIRKTIDGETVGFATGDAADIVLESLSKTSKPVKQPVRKQSVPITGGVKTGSVRKWLSEKGYGFITPDDGTEDMFVHQSAIDMDGFRMLEEGQRVEFTEGTGRTGKPAAEIVRPI